ncbi:MAG TPA: hypothetical protein DG761_08665 [Gammaproteobacteria bacterium]|jgi:hypothetical protein|nr:hypothetical protein [Acidiferrobacteraceae bacterium]MDP6791331.1 PGPGW domain-containing protein [Arenicellales bacterium]HCX88085.1 hypothetical protein [Gammaproteobacteria bacterium]|tara:strand:+ start:581 stop:1012 length:432 start_codon:yes stop_codon:yes gene_type:complete
MLSETLNWIAAHPGVTGAVVIASLGLAVIYAALIFVAIGRMSPDYFVRDEAPLGAWRQRHPTLRWVGLLVKNALGVVLVLMGLAMLVLPGQGVLTLLIGISLLDFPGKRALEKKIVCMAAVHTAINSIRRRAGKPPLVLPQNS